MTAQSRANLPKESISHLASTLLSLLKTTHFPVAARSDIHSWVASLLGLRWPRHHWQRS